MSGTSPSREDVRDSMEKIKNLDLGLLSPISYGPNKHKGAMKLRLCRMNYAQSVCKEMTDWVDVPY